jgi:hypothetical protein
MHLWFASDEEQKVFKEIESYSDRAAAIVAAVIVERRVEQQIVARLHNHPKPLDRLFRTSGPMGTFSAKIDLAHLMGIYGPDAYRDLVTLKNIRNSFAHHLDIVDFKSERINDLCKNLKLLDVYVVDSEESGLSLTRPNLNQPDIIARVRLKDRDKELEDPRNRYLVSAILFDMLLRVRRGTDGEVRPPLF